MSNKMICLFSFILAMAVVSDASADLIGYWKLDEGVGTTVADSSGRGHHGFFAEGTPAWVEGMFGNALKFNGSNKVEIPDHPDFHLEDAVSMALWIKPEAAIEPEYAKPFIKQKGPVEYPYAIQYAGNGTNIRATVNTSGPFDTSGTPNFPGQWGHLCMTYDGSAVILYKDGEEVARIAASGKIQGNDLPLSIGGRLGSTQNFIGIIDDVRLYSHALTKLEILQVMEGPPAGPASKPSPDNGQTDVPRDVVLSWTPGEFAPPVNGHKVYFSESFDDVNDGIGGVTQSASSYTPPQRLDFGTTYYWRVDEVNNVNPESPWTGSIWSFTTELFSHPIQNITATASSQFNANTGPENTVNGSGLDDNDLHSKQEADIWVSSMTGPQPTWIYYEFDRVYKLYEMWVWNHNTSIEPVLGFGIKDATIEYSVDGANWTTLGTAHEFARAPGDAGYAHDTTVDLAGVPAKYVKITANSNWGGVLPQYGLSEVRFFHIPIVAREPDPASGATDADADGVLSWRAGREAASHNVYISSDEQAVIDETISPVSIPAGSSYANYNTGPLDVGQSYYWKVNEVNEAETPSTWQGDVWNFSTREYLVVEDFEDYNDFEPDRIFDTWIDGWTDPTKGGSQVGSADPPFAELTIVHSGKQSMPFFYDNTGTAAYSEAERTFAAPQNWTEHGVKTLSLWFSGAADNVAGQLYVKVNGSKVTYDGAASNLTRGGWQVWNIELTSFGVNLQSVTRLSIGIDGSGAKGILYLDDVRLYPYDRQFITPTEPSQVGLIGHWKFDGDTQDSSGRGNHGTVGGNPTFVAGAVGSNALELDGDDLVVIDGVVDDITSTDITLSIWIKTRLGTEGELFAANDSASAHPFMLGIQVGNPFVNDGVDIQFPPPINDGQWHMLTYVRSGNTGYIYVDGLERGTYSAGFDLGSVTRWSIGQEWDDATPSDFYVGTVDDARFYDYALSDTEVAWLTGRTMPFDKPF